MIQPKVERTSIMETLSNLKKGDKVYFGRNFGEKTLGEVVKVNRVKVKVKQIESRGTYKSYPVGTVWTVPVSLLTKAEGSPAPRVMPPEVQNRLRENQDRDFAFMRGMDTPKPKRAEADILNEIRRIYSGLSPENLHADGERSRSEAARLGRLYNRQLQNLFRELGRQVSEAEAFS